MLSGHHVHFLPRFNLQAIISAGERCGVLPHGGVAALHRAITDSAADVSFKNLTAASRTKQCALIRRRGRSPLNKRHLQWRKSFAQGSFFSAVKLEQQCSDQCKALSTSELIMDVGGGIRIAPHHQRYLPPHNKLPCGGGLEYFNHSTGSRKRLQNGNPVVSNETVRCGHEFCGTWTGEGQQIVRVNYRPVFSSGMAPYNMKTVNVLQ
jgi:hypothetical protein